MTTRSGRTGSSFRKIRQQSRDYFQELLKENEQLRHLHVICQERHKDSDEASEESIAQFETREVNQNDRLLSEQYLALEQQIGNLARLYVASCRLHGTLDRAQVLNAIEEIIVNLIGSEELAVFERTADGLALSLVVCRGIEAERYRTIPIGRGQIGQTAKTGELFLAEPGGPKAVLPEERNLSACIPLVLDGRVIGEIAVFRLLSQKEGFTEFDEELFELLSRQAASALFCTRLYERRTPVTT